MREFEFVEEGKTFRCSVEVPHRTGMAPWWWFSVDTGTNTRYAPFEAAPTDTERSVRKRITAYYAELLAIQARPVLQRPSWQNRQKTAAAATAASAATSPAPPVVPPTPAT